MGAKWCVCRGGCVGRWPWQNWGKWERVQRWMGPRECAVDRIDAQGFFLLAVGDDGFRAGNDGFHTDNDGGMLVLGLETKGRVFV